MRNGYLCFNLCKSGHRANGRIHVLVLLAFVGPRPEGQQARHLNGNATDNRRVNLAWGTPKQNTADSIRHGTQYAVCVAAKFTHCPANHPYDEANTYDRPDGGRGCRTCLRDAKRRYYWRDPEKFRAISREVMPAYRARKKAARARKVA